MADNAPDAQPDPQPDMNTLIRRSSIRSSPRYRGQREPEPDEAPAPPPVDLGAGPRASTPPVDPSKAFNAWVRQQARKSKLAPQTVEAPLSGLTRKESKP